MESIIEAFVLYKKQINDTVLECLMNSGWRGVQILKQYDSARGARIHLQMEGKYVKD